jgi:hypothetical protein
MRFSFEKKNIKKNNKIRFVNINFIQRLNVLCMSLKGYGMTQHKINP